MTKVFIFDLDGTLFNHQGEPFPETLEALKLARLHGHIVIAATGRSLFSSKQALSRFDVFDYYICNNGVLIYDIKNNKFTLNNHLNYELMNYIYDIAQKSCSLYTISTAESSYPMMFDNCDYSWLNNQEKMDYKETEYVDKSKMNYIVQNKEFITQLALRNSQETIKNIYNDLIHLKENYSTFVTNRVYLDVNPLNSDKNNGVQTILKQLNLSNKNTVVFGDSGNDVEMIKQSDYGIAMGNGTQEAKSVAKEVIGPNTEISIANKILEILGLEKY